MRISNKLFLNVGTNGSFVSGITLGSDGGVTPVKKVLFNEKFDIRTEGADLRKIAINESSEMVKHEELTQEEEKSVYKNILKTAQAFQG